jgi:pilus assembly protein Flp/PilA
MDMNPLKAAVRRVRASARNEEGATMVEYALMVALIAVVVIAGATLLGNSVNQKLNDQAMMGPLQASS